MVFRPIQKDLIELITTMEINCIKIEPVSEVRNLGVIID